jgi:uncharacterized membrane protein
MRYLKATLAGLSAGCIFVIAITTIEFLLAARRLQAATTCADFQCFGAVQVESVWELLVAFFVGFAIAFAWFLRRRRAIGP